MHKYDVNVTVSGSSQSFKRTYRVFARDADAARKAVWSIAQKDVSESRREHVGNGSFRTVVLNRFEGGRENWIRNRGPARVASIADVEIRSRVFLDGTDFLEHENAGFVYANDGTHITVRPHLKGRPDQRLTWVEFQEKWSVNLGVYV